VPNSESATLEQLPLARLKRERPGIRASVYKLRRRVEAELLASGGGTIVATVRLASACTYYRWYLKAEEKEYLLRGTLTLSEWTSIGDRATKWLEKTVSLLVDLGLDKPLAARLVEAEGERMKRMWDDLYSGRLDAADGQPVAEYAPPSPQENAGKGNHQGTAQSPAEAKFDAAAADDDAGDSTPSEPAPA
jgi:hypothetical protein